MAKTKAKSVATAASPTSVLPPIGSTLAPLDPTHISVITWSKDRIIHRIHPEQYSGDQFNPGVKGNARFSPIEDAANNPIPTIYGGTTIDCAAMETVFHDVPHAPGFKSIDKKKLEEQSYTQLKSKEDLQLVDLSNTALRKLGYQRNQVVDTEKDKYPFTRQLAASIHATSPDVQGLHWTSRQDDRAQAIMLFGDRIPSGTLEQVSVSKNLVKDDATYDEMLKLADRIGVNVVPGKS